MSKELTRGRASAEARTATGLVSQLVWAISGSIALVVILIATTLEPAAVGHGTHTQLGLPPCGFFVVTGMPCPGCGLTTAFAHMVRFEWALAARANAFGVPLFLSTALYVPLSVVGVLRRWPVVPTLERLRADYAFVLLAASAMVNWVVRLLSLNLS